MIKYIKHNIALVILIILHLSLLVWRLNGVPNSHTPEEVIWLKTLPWVNSFFVLRCVGAGISTFFIIAAYTVRKRFEKKQLALFIGTLPFVFAPWLFLLGKFLTMQTFVALCIVGLGIFLTGRKNITSITVGMFVVAVIIFRQLIFHDAFQQMVDLPQNIIRLVDVRQLFFIGESNSSSLRIPKTGYFLFVDLFFLFIGIISLFRMNKNNLKSIIFFLLMSIGWAIWYPLDHALATYSQIFFLFCVTHVIGAGYVRLFQDLYVKRLFIPAALICCVIVANIGFYQDMFYSHFDRHVSHEWGYAEETVLKELQGKKNIATVLVSVDSSKILEYLPAYRFPKTVFLRMKSKEITREVVNQCRREETVCVIKEHELPAFGLTKETAHTIRYYGGLPAYFTL